MVNEAVKNMLSRYRCHSMTDYENALKEIIQEIALLGLWRAKFFEKAAFYGGTALRILYGLDRFSEDLDFSLLQTDKDFDFSQYNQAVQVELQSFGFDANIEVKRKALESTIQSAFIKAKTMHQMLTVDFPEHIVQRIPRGQKLKIRMEVDVDPPGDFETEAKTLLHPIPFSVHTFQQPDLFAGKMHAILCRAWKNRVKGRDWYDLVWYIRHAVPIRLRHLQARLVQSGCLQQEEKLDRAKMIALIQDKIETVDFESAKQEVRPFLKDVDSVAIWSKTFFREILDHLKTI
jgi:predicted nucleotidyltransferase component of viral defense system